MKYVEKNDPRETPKDNPREQTDWKLYPHTSELWKQNAQHVTDSPSLGEHRSQTSRNGARRTLTD
jgi:hypothetical protein